MGYWSREARHAYYEKNKSNIKKQTSDYYKQNRAKYKALGKANNLRRRYSLSVEDYEKLLEQARFRCQICTSIKSLCVDHDHRTGKIRGIICASCNVGLGHFLDSEVVLQEAIDYLRRYK